MTFFQKIFFCIKNTSKKLLHTLYQWKYFATNNHEEFCEEIEFQKREIC